MNDTIRDEVARLGELRLPDLQVRYAEVVGETTRCPNKKWLVLKIGEAMVQAAESVTTGTEVADASAAEPDRKGVSLRELSVAELQDRHLEVIGRPTRSSHVGYLRWRLRQAERGRIPVVSSRQPRREGESPDFKVLPFRMETTVVSRLDEARKRLGLASRSELLRRALHSYLLGSGESDVAELLLPGEVG